MRRLVRHAAAGIGVSAVIATFAVATLGGTSDSVEAIPLPLATAADAPAGTAARQISDVSRDAERKQLADMKSAAATKLASERAKVLSEQSEAVNSESERLKVSAARRAKVAAEAKAKADAEKAKADAAEAKAKADKAASDRAKAEAEADRTKNDDSDESTSDETASDESKSDRANNQGVEPGTTDPRTMAKQILKNKFGYGESQFVCFDNIIKRESMYKINARNPSSGAYGIPQALPGSKMASVGSDWRTNPATQIIWAVKYMDDRYGSPCQAWTFKRAKGWY